MPFDLTSLIGMETVVILIVVLIVSALMLGGTNVRDRLVVFGRIGIVRIVMIVAVAVRRRRVLSSLRKRKENVCLCASTSDEFLELREEKDIGLLGAMFQGVLVLIDKRPEICCAFLRPDDPPIDPFLRCVATLKEGGKREFDETRGGEASIVMQQREAHMQN